MTAIPRNPTADFTSTTLNGSVNDSTQTITVNDASTIQTPTYGVIDREDNNGVAQPNQREVVYISSKSSNDLTVTRGVNNSTARSHNDGAKFEPLFTVGFWSDFYSAYDNEHTMGDGSHDITKIAVLSGTTIQTLSNKILSSPTIVTPTISGIANAQGLVLISVASINTLDMNGDFVLNSGVSPNPGTAGVFQWRTGDNAIALGGSLFAAFGAWQAYTPTVAGFSADPSGIVARYALFGKTCIYNVYMPNTGTSNATSFTITAPFTSRNATSHFLGYGQGTDNGAYQANVLADLAPNTATITLNTGGGATGWTNSGNKAANFTLIFEIA